MTNLNIPYGLKPIMSSNGDTIKYGRYLVPASLASVAINTPVTLGTTSNSNNSVGGRPVKPASLPTIAIATGGDGNKLLGSIIGFESNPLYPLGDSDYNAANTERIAFVANDKDQIFTVVDDGANAIGITAINLNANLTMGTVNPASHIDSSSLDTTTPATTNTFQLKILKANPIEGNDPSLASTEFVVQINNHCLANATAGV